MKLTFRKEVRNLRMTNQELVAVEGGAITASFLNALSRAANTIMDIGRAIGSSIRRVFSGNYC